MSLFLAYDVGTTACKSCLYSITDKLELVDYHINEYPIITTSNGDGGVEQLAEDWWNAIREGTKIILSRTNIQPSKINGIAFCCQMQGTIVVDKEGDVLRNPMIWMDSRSTAQMKRNFQSGLLKIEGMNAIKALKFLKITGGAPGTAKDPIWKYLWIKDNEPDIFNKIYKWLDVKDYLTFRCTGNYKQTLDSAHLTWVYNTQPGKLGWSKSLCKTYKIEMDHLPEVINSTDIIGGLTKNAANDLGLIEGIPIFGGGGDASMIPIGAGCVDLFDTHIYIGTSGWVVSNVKERWVDLKNFIASILNAIPDHYNYIAEQETAGYCLEWVRDHLAMDEIGLYMDAKNVVDQKDEYDTLYDYLNEAVTSCEDGSGNVIFTPWLHGNRAPREDPYVRGMFFNIGIETGKRQMIRSVLEGVAYNVRWLLEACEKKIPLQKSVRMVGGGAKSEIWCQIMSDITGRTIETIDNPQNVGSAGAALTSAIGSGIIKSFKDVKQLIPIKLIYNPRKECQSLHERNFSVFKQLYDNNKKLYKILNAG